MIDEIKQIKTKFKLLEENFNQNKNVMYKNTETMNNEHQILRNELLKLDIAGLQKNTDHGASA